MPTVDYIGVSKKIRDEQERDRLRAIASRLKPEGMGIIIRTVANGIAEAELIADITYLLHTWQSVLRRYELARKPKLLYREADLVMRTIRDYCTDDVKKIVVDDKETYERICLGIRRMTAGDNGSACMGDEPVFELYHLEEQLRSLVAREVPLPSGGNLIFDRTEALTVIDVASIRHNTQEKRLFRIRFSTSIKRRL